MSTIQERAQAIRSGTAAPSFTGEEAELLSRFFSNHDRNTFFIFGMPEELVSTLISMYSRIKNPRGLRGLFLESFTKDIPEVLKMGFDPQILKDAVSATKIRKFMSTWLDKYGHNSIARTGVVHLCFEKVSVMAAKCIEEGRPGAGYLELSTRYVDMSKAGVYPIGQLMERPEIDDHVLACFDDYQKCYKTEEENFARLAKLIGVNSPSDAQMTGKLGDHVGNLLPCAVYTSVGCTLQGEAFQRLVNHLIRENDPECAALAAEVVSEAKKTGADVLLGSHYEPTQFERTIRNSYLGYYPFSSQMDRDASRTEIRLEDIHCPLSLTYETRHPRMMERIEHNSSADHEKRRQKLSRTFEMGSATFIGLMSFRTWRDMHRQGFSTHWRSLVAFNDLYVPPDMSVAYNVAAHGRYHSGKALYESLVPSPSNGATETEVALQKMCQMGQKVLYRIHSNLRQWEFVCWQRTKYGAHHEVRAHSRAISAAIAQNVPWWTEHARVNDHDYFFARGAELPPVDTAILTKGTRYPWI